MLKKMQMLKELEVFSIKANELFMLQKSYLEKAASFDKEWKEWSEKHLPTLGDQMHPCHIIKSALEASIELPQPAA